MAKYKVYVLSDSVGETAEAVAKATVTQFSNADIDMEKISHVGTPSKIDKIISEMDTEKSMIIFTIVLEPLKEYLIRQCEEKGIKYIDVMTNSVNTLSELTGSKPYREPGVMRRLNEEYFKRIQAVEFAVKYDDGKILGEF